MEYDNSKSQRRRKFQNNTAHRDSGRRRNQDPGREANIQVFQHTQRYFNVLRLTVPRSVLYDADEVCSQPPPEAGEVKVEIEVVNSDTFDLAQRYTKEGHRVLVLNMASDFKPGGGVRSGSTAQEECLFRRSNAVMTHPAEWYPLQPTHIVYSPEVRVIKDKNNKMLDQHQHFDVGMVAVAALRKPRLFDGEYQPRDERLMRSKIEAIFRIAIENGFDALVLGALGCGVFQNPPEQVAGIFDECIKQYGSHFRKIGFAVLAVGRAGEGNLKTFRSRIGH